MYELFLGFKEGKENTSSVAGKRQRKPVAPPTLTANLDSPGKRGLKNSGDFEGSTGTPDSSPMPSLMETSPLPEMDSPLQLEESPIASNSPCSDNNNKNLDNNNKKLENNDEEKLENSDKGPDNNNQKPENECKKAKISKGTLLIVTIYPDFYARYFMNSIRKLVCI